MEHLTALMIIIGCSGPTTCQQLPAPAAGYESVSQCRRYLKSAMIDRSAQGRQVYGDCENVGSAAFERDASVTWDLSVDGRISVRVVDGDGLQAAGESVVASR